MALVLAMVVLLACLGLCRAGYHSTALATATALLPPLSNVPMARLPLQARGGAGTGARGVAQGVPRRAGARWAAREALMLGRCGGCHHAERRAQRQAGFAGSRLRLTAPPPSCSNRAPPLPAGPAGEVLVDHKRSAIAITRRDMACMAHLQVGGRGCWRGRARKRSRIGWACSFGA